MGRTALHYAVIAGNRSWTKRHEFIIWSESSVSYGDKRESVHHQDNVGRNGLILRVDNLQQKPFMTTWLLQDAG